MLYPLTKSVSIALKGIHERNKRSCNSAKWLKASWSSMATKLDELKALWSDALNYRKLRIEVDRYSATAQAWKKFIAAILEHFPALCAEFEALEQFVNGLYAKCPDMKDEGLESFDGYFTTWDEIVEVFKEKDPNVCWDDSPKELLVSFMDEYELLKHQLAERDATIQKVNECLSALEEKYAAAIDLINSSRGSSKT